MDNSPSRGVFHKEKVAKRNTDVQKPVASRTVGSRTDGNGTDGNGRWDRVARLSSPPQTEVTDEQKQMAIDQTAKAKAERRAQSIKTLEIDDFLFGLVIDDLLNEEYIPYAAKCCYTLGLQHVNKIVLQVRQAQCNGEGQSKKKLLSWKLKGAMGLHFKRQYYEQQRAEQASLKQPSSPGLDGEQR